jgi:hypothetical protein
MMMGGESGTSVNLESDIMSMGKSRSALPWTTRKCMSVFRAPSSIVYGLPGRRPVLGQLAEVIDEMQAVPLICAIL